MQCRYYVCLSKAVVKHAQRLRLLCYRKKFVFTNYFIYLLFIIKLLLFKFLSVLLKKKRRYKRLTIKLEKQWPCHFYVIFDKKSKPYQFVDKCLSNSCSSFFGGKSSQDIYYEQISKNREVNYSTAYSYEYSVAHTYKKRRRSFILNLQLFIFYKILFWLAC